MLFDVSGRSRAQAGRAGRTEDWATEPDEPRDWKKLVLVAGLGILSWVATYVGMLELIEANMGELPLVHKVIIAFSVGMLMTMIIWLLDRLFSPLGFVTRLLYLAGYVFLSIISVGFGFGFYWKVLESRSEASRSAEGAVGQVQGALYAASTRLDQLTTTLDGLTQISRQKADVERSAGTSCPGSRPGDGPRRKLRDDDASRFSFAADFVKGRATQVKSDMAALDGDLAKLTGDDKSIIDPRTGTRNEFMKALSRKLDLTVTGFNAFRTDPQLKQIRADLAERSDKITFTDTRGGTYSCPDAQLSTALKGVVRAIDGLPELEKPKIAAVEGSEATIEAFRRLTTTFFGALTLKLPPSADEQRELQKKAIQSVEGPQAGRNATLEAAAGLSKRDYVPLAVAVFVDLCLLLVSMGRPVNRLGNLVPRMREAERGPVIRILSRFSDIHRDAKMRESFEVLRHVVFDYAGAYYVAVPLDAPFTETRAEQVLDPTSRKARLVHKQFAIPAAKREQLRVDAHLIANLFTSFEKDGVFKRVMWLNTEAARRRLRQQGSKFANAEAFRIYRFVDGAWSEIILGAVMGAAKRVEDRRAAGEDIRGTEPSFDSLADRMRQAADEEALEPDLPMPKPVFERRAAFEGRQHGGIQPAPDADLVARFGPYAGRAAMEHGEDVGRSPAGAGHPGATDGYGIAQDSVGPANSNTRTASPPPRVATAPGWPPAAAEPDNVVPFKQQVRPADFGTDALPQMRMPNILTRGRTALAAETDPQTRDVTVTATERRFSFSLPMNDPRVGGSLYGLASALQGSVPVVAPGTPSEVSGPAADAARPAVSSEAHDTGHVDSGARTPATGTSATIITERPSALSLPGPTMEHEHRG